MSRIDQALRNWETAKGAVPSGSTATDPAHASALANYPVEGISPLLQEPEPLPPLMTEPAATRKPVARVRNNADIAARLVTGESNSVSLEQYRRLAAVLHEEQMRGSLKTVMVTSALPGEGKTLTIANLAHTLSGSYGRRVLVIDADLRAPSLHRILGLRNSTGLSEALRAGVGTQLPFVEVSPGLSALTAGRPGPSPLAELSSGRMGEIIRECASSFDWVLIDTPPVGLLSDAQVLVRLVGGVVFVIAAGTTPRAAVERAISEIGTDPIIGTVLNRVEDRRIPEANYYDGYYGDDTHPGE